MTGMKGTLKLSSVAEEEKSKLVPDEETDAPPPLVFLSAMAADPRPLRGSTSPVRHHRPETDHPGCHRTSALAHGGHRPRSYSGTRFFFRKLEPPKSNKAESASGPSLSCDTSGFSRLGGMPEPQRRGAWPLRGLVPSTGGR